MAIFSKTFHKSVIAIIAPLSLLATPAIAGHINYKYASYKPAAPVAVPCGHFYLGAFYARGSSNHDSLTQKGTALYPVSSGGPLAVNAHGNSTSNTTNGGGLHVGYEWRGLVKNSAWNVMPAAELEGYYLGVTQNGSLTNPTPRLPEHDFHDTFPMNTGVILANSVWSVKVPCLAVQPYIGGGIGTAIVSIYSAKSKQVSPAEPGINHFNSNRDASDWTFAAQAKAGMHIVLDCHWRLFAEYRFLYLSPTSYTFGSTQYPTHVATTNWKVNIGSMNYNMGAAGIQYIF